MTILKFDRWFYILNKLIKDQVIDVKFLSSYFEVSESLIYRDIKHLKESTYYIGSRNSK